MHSRISPARRRSGRRARILLVVASIAATLLACEVVARVVAWRQEVAALAAWQGIARERPPPEPGAKLRLESIIRLAQNPRIVYELIPGLDVQYVDVPVRTDEHGFRGMDVAQDKPPGTWRIVVIGDSVAFGHGVREEDCFPWQLRGMLQQQVPDLRVEVVNTAVPGYNTAMEVETLVEKGLRFAPDLVVYHYVSNDLDLPNLIWSPRDFWAVGESFLWEQLQRAWAPRDPWVERPWRHPPTEAGRFVYAEGSVAPMYRDMVGIEMFRRELERLRDLAREHGFHVVVSSDYECPPYVQMMCNAAALRHAPTQPRIQRYMKDNGIERYWPSALTLSETDPHPTALGHRLIAETILDDLRASSRLPR